MCFDQRVNCADSYADAEAHGDLGECVPVDDLEFFGLIRVGVGINLVDYAVHAFRYPAAGQTYVECVIHCDAGKHHGQREQRAFELFGKSDARYKRHCGCGMRAGHTAGTHQHFKKMIGFLPDTGIDHLGHLTEKPS